MNEPTRRIKRYDELTFVDDFMFCKVLQKDPELCKSLTELILGQKIGSIIQIEKQHAIEILVDRRGVRFDVYMKDDRNTVYDIEMQTTLLPELPKRTRYYQSMIDVESLERSVNYRNLPNSYVIFISLYNPFPEYGLHKYTFGSTCDENSSLKLQDGAKRIFLSAEGTANDVSDDLQHFLHYLVDQSVHSELTQKLEAAVESARHRSEWSMEYMTLYEMRELDLEEGRKEGRKEGLEEGQKTGKIMGMIQIYYNDLHLKPEEIALKVGKSVDEVNRIIAELNHPTDENK